MSTSQGYNVDERCQIVKMFRWHPDMIAETDAAVAHGALHITTGHLTALTGRPATALSTAVAAALSVLDEN
jgi:hypothetical protein